MNIRTALATAAVGLAALAGCTAATGPDIGTAVDPWCAHVREAVAHGEAVDYVSGGWMLHDRMVYVESATEDGCWNR